MEEAIKPAEVEPTAEIIEPPVAFVGRLGVLSPCVFADATKDAEKQLAALTRQHPR